MGNYWPVVFWLYDIRIIDGEDVFIYRPSYFHVDIVRRCVSRDDAMMYAIRKLADNGVISTGGDNTRVPTRIIKVLHQKEKPATGEFTLALHIRIIDMGWEHHGYSDE